MRSPEPRHDSSDISVTVGSGNDVRSIMADAILNGLGEGPFEGSAGWTKSDELVRADDKIRENLA